MLRVWTVLVILFLCVACSNDLDDKLEGKWQLQRVESEGAVHQVDTVYYNFLTSLFRYQIYSPANDSHLYANGYKVNGENDQLFLEITGENPEAFLKHTDWTDLKRTFTVEKISKKQLILSSEAKQYIFRKF